MNNQQDTEKKESAIFCPICKMEAEILSKDVIKDGIKYTIYSCDHCGYVGYPQEKRDIMKYLLGESSILEYQLAGYLYENKTDNTFFVNEKNCKIIIDSNTLPKNATDYLDKICVNLYYVGDNFLRGISINDVKPSFGYAKDRENLIEMFNALIELKYVKLVSVVPDSGDSKRVEQYVLTYDGLKHAEDLISSNKESTKVFIAMGFNEKMEKAKSKGMKPACKKCGFDAITVNERQHNDDITDKIIAEIKTSRFVIADFTENNQGVYYEAGYAKGLDIPVIKTCNKEWFDKKDEAENKLNKLHFDIEHDNLILWENEKDLAERLEARIRATIL